MADENIGGVSSTLTIDDCLYLHDVLGLIIVCEDGDAVRVAYESSNDCKDA